MNEPSPDQEITREVSGAEFSWRSGNDLDPAQLYSLLEAALQQNITHSLENTWDQVRRWLWAHDTLEARQQAATMQGPGNVTSLHLICKLPNPPDDIVQALLEAAPEVASWQDEQGWLPLHNACANGASPPVLQCLIDAYPAGTRTQDNQMRAPLHFYATRRLEHPQTLVTNARLLADAADLTDRSGMLPLHYACAYGTDPVVLAVLVQVYPASLTATERKGRTPMHLAMVNAHRDAIPPVIRFLLEHAPDTVNARDQDHYLPLQLLAQTLRGYRLDGRRANISECLSLYLQAEPTPAPDFLSALQSLPESIRDTAVVSKHVRAVLNHKIVQPFPTMILMLDGYWLIVLIVCFGLSTANQIDMRFNGAVSNTTEPALGLLFVGATYFLLREIVQVWSLISLGSFSTWYTDMSNVLDLSVITMVYYFAFAMTFNFDLDPVTFRHGVAFTQGVLYTAVIGYLKSTYVDFAVFVGGVLLVVKRLSAFLIAVGVILLAFAQMFYFVYTDTELCTSGLSPDDPSYDPELDCRFPHCNFWSSLLMVYSMMMGEIGDEKRYSEGSTSLIAQILYVGYAFLVVILLSNVLIAIVTDSYEIVQNDRAASVFWGNRLDFVAEMDAIIYGVQRKLFRGKGKELDSTNPTPKAERKSYVDHFRQGWHQLRRVFDSNPYDDVAFCEACVYVVFRFLQRCVASLIIVPWILAGLLTAGVLWPPQIREFLFAQKRATVSRAEKERQKIEQLRAIQLDLLTLKTEIMREMNSDRDEMTRMKLDVEGVQTEVLSDLQQVRELMASILGN